MVYQRALTITLFLFLIIGISSVDCDEDLACRDEQGHLVDWYVLYKIPKIGESEDENIQKGTGYVYMTDQSIDKGWQLSKTGISSADSIPGLTLAPLYHPKLSDESLWILYNDQPPNKNSSISKYGHAKGVIISDKRKGFWLVHSVPNYPPDPFDDDDKSFRAAYDYPDSGTVNGQSFLCISLNSNQMNDIGDHLTLNEIISYRYNLPELLSKEFPSLINATNRPRIKNPPYYRRNEIVSIGGSKFITFAKNDKWKKDLYDDFVAPQLESDLLAETWLNGRGKLPSECNGSKVMNVQSIIFKSVDLNFKSTRDHSKWAVAMNNTENKNWVCIGDLNRADTQFNRGGGTVCINQKKLWKSYRESVNEIEPCPRIGFYQRIKSWVKSIFH